MKSPQRARRKTRPKIIAVVGPTASGKTSLAIFLAKNLRGEIVSADSRQIYRGMDMGTAKPTAQELRVIPHHLIDIKNPDENYTVAGYKDDAVAAIKEICARGKVPLLVGGTGLYIRAVLQNLDIPRVPADDTLREKIEEEIKREGLQAVVKKLISLDPLAAQAVDLKNPRRVVRAMEVTLATGKPFTSQRGKRSPYFDSLIIGMEVQGDELRERIDRRVDEMLSSGLVREVKKLIKKYDPNLPSFDAIGYREIIDYLRGKIALNEAAREIKLNTWHYARRQMTWFRKEKSIEWLHGGNGGAKDEALALAEKFLKTS